MLPTVWRHAATPETWELRVRAGALWLGKEAALAGQSAARWWGLDRFQNVESVEFVVPRGRRSVRGIELHTTLDWHAKDLLRHDGIRVTTVTRSIIDMSGHGVSLRRIEAAIDSGVRLRRTSIPTLVRRIAELDQPGRRGLRRLREALLDGGGESDLERRFLRLMRHSGLPRPVAQVRVPRSTAGAMRIDFLFPQASLMVEVSGRLGHASDRDRQKDARRRNALVDAGLRFKEFTTIDVIEDPDYVVNEIRRSLAS